MTRNFIPNVDEEYKFTRPEFAMFIGISTNALRMRMRRGGFGDMYVIKNGKYLFKRPGPLQDKRPLVDHVAAPEGTTKRIRNRGAHKDGTAKYTSEAFRRHNEMIENIKLSGFTLAAAASLMAILFWVAFKM